MKVVICLISTRRYHVFVQPLIDSICKYFLLRHQIEVHLFLDRIEPEYTGDERVKIIKELIPSYKFPEATLYRYAIMTSKKYNCDYLYYLDVDYLIVSEIDEDIFGDIVAVLHPGFARMGGGSWCTDENSNAYTFPENRLQYFCGGTNGGEHKHFFKLMQRLARDIADDEKRGIKAEHNDEAHLNKALSELNKFKILDSSYCMPEPMVLREAWKLTDLIPRILALDKNHCEIRN